MQDNRYEYNRHEGRPQDEIPGDVATLNVVRDYRRMYDNYHRLMQANSNLRRENGDLRLSLALTKEVRRNATQPRGRNGRPLGNPEKVANMVEQNLQMAQNNIADARLLADEVAAAVEGPAREPLLKRIERLQSRLATMADFCRVVISTVEE